MGHLAGLAVALRTGLFVAGLLFEGF